ncbi:hypothetical protein [Sphaerisporangium perillae]|uniref:hypothetical protein n=1 Tax=Sphaerisporangium perillae TaxID=2935860 RepID=UPI00200EB859|nr:hypothetical protein [Sphaerisporangium perillae]
MTESCRYGHNGGLVARRVASVGGMRMRAALAAVAVGGTCLLGSGCADAGAERPFTPAGDTTATDPAGTATTGPSVATTTGPGATPGSANAPGALSTPWVQTVELTPGMTVSIEWPAGLDAAQQAMVKAFTDGYVGSWKAVVTQGEDEAYLSGVEDQASRDAYTWVRGFVDRRESAGGTAKVYAIQVPSVSGRGAEVDACVDESGVRVTDADSARPIATQPAWTRQPASVYLQVAAVRKGDDGMWRVRTYMHASYPHQRAKECRR